MTRRFMHLVVSLAVALSGVLVVAVATPAAQAVGDRDCGDFSTQAAAQQFYINHGGPQSDPHRLDDDGDGIACESNPCPCSTAQGGTGGDDGAAEEVEQVRPGPGRCTWTYKDKAADAQAAINVKKTTLDVCRKGYVRVKVFGGDFVKNRTDMVRVYFDTVRKRKGPEYNVSWYLGKNPYAVTGLKEFGKAKGWRNSDLLECTGIGYGVSYKRDMISVAVPRKCLGSPASVRWSGFTGRITRPSLYGYWDDFPRENEFPTTWVA